MVLFILYGVGVAGLSLIGIEVGRLHLKRRGSPKMIRMKALGY